jgi:hypothetical protein
MFIKGLQLFRPFFMRPSSGPGLQKDGCLKLVECNLQLQLTTFKHPSFCKPGPDYGLIKKGRNNCSP